VAVSYIVIGGRENPGTLYSVAGERPPRTIEKAKQLIIIKLNARFQAFWEREKNVPMLLQSLNVLININRK
jgi:predicted dienelactone hydrolase